MHTNKPESWNYFAINSLNRSLLEQNAAIIASFKKKKKYAVGWQQFYRYTVSNRYQVFDFTCIAFWVRQQIFPIYNKQQRLADYEQIDESCMRTKSRTYPLFSESG